MCMCVCDWPGLIASTREKAATHTYTYSSPMRVKYFHQIGANSFLLLVLKRYDFSNLFMNIQEAFSVHILLSYQRSRDCQIILAYFPDSEDFLTIKCSTRASFTIPLELLVTKDVVNDTL
jgi:hypothetical protein